MSQVLRVHLKRCTDVLVADSNGKSDPYVTLAMGHPSAVNSLALPRSETPDLADSTKQPKVRVQIIRHARTHSVGKHQSCMF